MSKMSAIYLACQELYQAGEFYSDIVHKVSFDYNCSVIVAAQTLNVIMEKERNNVS